MTEMMNETEKRSQRIVVDVFWWSLNVIVLSWWSMWGVPSSWYCCWCIWWWLEGRDWE